MFDRYISLWNDAWGYVSSEWDQFGNWLIDNDQLFNTITIYTLGLGFFLFFIVKGVTYLVVRHQHPETDVGVALRGQKAAETGMFFLLTMVFFGFPLLPLGIWERVILRILLDVSIVAGGIGGIRFMLALRSERWGLVDTQLDARRADQEIRAVALDVRGDEQDIRGEAQDIRGEAQDVRELSQDKRDDSFV